MMGEIRMQSPDLWHYLFFLFKALTLVASILVVIIVTLSLTAKAKIQKNQLLIKNLSKKYFDYKKMLYSKCCSKTEQKNFKKYKKNKNKSIIKKKLFVIDFKGDIQASNVTALREEVDAVLLIADSDNDRVMLRLENQGGTIHGHGLAAAQLKRLRHANIHLTVCIDKVATSGGYMMAAVAHHIIASPFAIIGSIGVLVQLPNFHHLLKKKSIGFEQITAGEYKRTLSVFGKNTHAGREKMQSEINAMHDTFKQFIKKHRPEVDISITATGEYWLGETALHLKLIDELNLSDQFILDCSQTHNIYHLIYTVKKPFLSRLIQHAMLCIRNILQQKSDTTSYL
jgi:serine protease SohB